MKIIFLSISLIILPLVFYSDDFYQSNPENGFYYTDPHNSFYDSGVNNRVDLLQKTNALPEKISTELKNSLPSEYEQEVKKMSLKEITEALTEQTGKVSENTADVDEARKDLILVKEYFAKFRELQATMKKAGESLEGESEAFEKQIDNVKRNVKVGFFLSYSNPDTTALSRYDEKLINKLMNDGYNVFIVVRSKGDNDKISDYLLQKVHDIAIDFDGTAINNFKIKSLPSAAGFVPIDGTVLPLFEGKQYADVTEKLLIKQYSLYLSGDSGFDKIKKGQ